METPRTRPDIPPPADAPLSERFGKFVRTVRLGAGGGGEVWKAWDTELARWVALKLLRGGDDEEIARFKREAQTAAKLSHPNIAATYDVGNESGRHYIAMQFIDGQTLGTFPRDDVRVLVELMRDAARAIDSAHRLGIVHRDLKPANLMVESASRRVYVMDFGLARRTDVESGLSQTGAIMGTPAYMPPEQARGRSREIDARSDVYSLGATLYELLADRPPFRDPDIYGLLKKVIEDEPKALRALKPSIDAELETIVTKCLEKEPSRRYATAADLADDLSRWLAGEEIHAHPASALYRLRKRLLKRRGVIAALAVGLAAVVAVGVVFGVRMSRERATAAARESDLKNLTMLWGEVVLAKQGMHIASEDPKRVRGRIEEALGRVSAFIAAHPVSPEALYLRARGRLYLDDVAAAESDLREALRQEPAFTPGRELLARVLLERYSLGFYGASDTLDERRRVRAPLLKEASELLTSAMGGERRSLDRWGLPRSPEDAVTEILSRAFDAVYVRNDEPAALRLLTEANEREPAEELMNWIGRLSSDADEIIRWQSRAIERRPHFAVALADRGHARFAKGDAEEAVRDLSRALEITPSLQTAWFQRGCARSQLGDHDGAAADFTESLRLLPNDDVALSNRGNAHRSRAMALFRAGRNDEAASARASAIDDYTASIAIRPTAEAHIGRGVEKLKNRDLEGARRDYDAAVALAPQNAVARFNRGAVREALQDSKGALEDFSEAIRINPKYVAALQKRAALRSRTGDAGGAIEDLTAWIAESPTAQAHFDRGVLHASLGLGDKAADDFDAAVKLQPDFPEALANRGSARAARGDLNGAIDDFRKALACSPADWIYRAQVTEALERAIRERGE